MIPGTLQGMKRTAMREQRIGTFLVEHAVWVLASQDL
jgi:hypothetical protein